MCQTNEHDIHVLHVHVNMLKSIYIKTYLIRHALGDKFCVGIDRMSD
mgnify:CR=1 FL=1